MHKQNLPLEGSLVFSFELATDVGDILKDQLPICEPYQTSPSYTTPRKEGGSPEEDTHTCG